MSTPSDWDDETNWSKDDEDWYEDDPYGPLDCGCCYCCGCSCDEGLYGDSDWGDE